MNMDFKVLTFIFSVSQVNQLIGVGVPVNFFDTQDTQNTPLHWVASFGDVNTAECLCGKIHIP